MQRPVTVQASSVRPPPLLSPLSPKYFLYNLRRNFQTFPSAARRSSTVAVGPTHAQTHVTALPSRTVRNIIITMSVSRHSVGASSPFSLSLSDCHKLNKKSNTKHGGRGKSVQYLTLWLFDYTAGHWQGRPDHTRSQLMPWTTKITL